MISTLVCVCAIFWAFERIMRLAMVTEWDIQPVVILLLVMISAVRLRAMIHRRLT